MIIDNADDHEMNVSEFFPPGEKGSIIVTTRNSECRHHATAGSLRIEQMKADDAVTLLLRAIKVNDASDEVKRCQAGPVVWLLGNLALAVVQAGFQIRQGICKLEDYCEQYSKDRTKLLREAPIQGNNDYSKSVYAILDIAMRKIESLDTQASYDATELIKMCCFLHNEGIAEDFFRLEWEAQSRHKLQMPWKNSPRMFYMQSQQIPSQWDPTQLRRATSILTSFSLMKINEVDRLMSMHPLVRAWTQDRLSFEEKKHYWKMATLTMCGATVAMSTFVVVPEDPFWRVAWPHAQSCAEFIPTLGNAHPEEDRITVQKHLANALTWGFQTEPAIDLLKEVIEQTRRSLSVVYDHALVAMDNVANQYENIDPRHELALEVRAVMRKMTLKPLNHDHPEILDLLRHLAINYSNSGKRLQEAVDLLTEILTVQIRTRGHNNRLTSAVRADLIDSYCVLGSWEAWQIFENSSYRL